MNLLSRTTLGRNENEFERSCRLWTLVQGRKAHLYQAIMGQIAGCDADFNSGKNPLDSQTANCKKGIEFYAQR